MYSHVATYVPDGLKFFEYWSGLAAKDPEQFEIERKKAVEKAIFRSSERIQKRLWRMQWHIDTLRARARNPLVFGVRLNQMMWESICAERGFLNAHIHFLEWNTAFFERYNLPPPGKTRVLPFKRK
ncbi:MAG: DUF3135 domain-containing protein [Candidatus Paceibacterota bacterium]|jgi:hypothetical protein